MSSAAPSDDHSSRSGITTAANGESVIPSSTRADGSVRKEIKVRPGYRPPEDVEVYKNRTAEAFKNRGKGGVPGAQFVRREPAATTKAQSKKQKAAASEKNSRTNEARTNGNSEPATTSLEESASQKEQLQHQEEPVLDPEEENEKQARKLSKKLRQAKDLAQKKENGESLLPEQFEKVIRINELIRQLDNLGFNAEGQKKT